MTIRQSVATKLRNFFVREVYVRLGEDDEFICTTRYAGFRIRACRFHFRESPQVDLKQPAPRAIYRLLADQEEEA